MLCEFEDAFSILESACFVVIHVDESARMNSSLQDIILFLYSLHPRETFIDVQDVLKTLCIPMTDVDDARITLCYLFDVVDDCVSIVIFSWLWKKRLLRRRAIFVPWGTLWKQLMTKSADKIIVRITHHVVVYVTCRLSDYSIVSPRVPDDAVFCVESSVFQETKEHQQLKHDCFHRLRPFCAASRKPERLQ